METGVSSQMPGCLDETQTCQGQSLPEVEEGGSSTRSLRQGDPKKGSCPLPFLLDAGRVLEARLSLAESGKITWLASGTLESQDLGKRALDFRRHPTTWESQPGRGFEVPPFQSTHFTGKESETQVYQTRFPGS